MIKKSLAHVTDHAVLRYLERVQGMDIERVRREIGRSVDRAVDMGACSVVVEGFRYTLSPNGSVITVAAAVSPAPRPGRPRRD